MIRNIIERVFCIISVNSLKASVTLWLHFLTEHYINLVATAKKFLVVVSNSIRVCPRPSVCLIIKRLWCTYRSVFRTCCSIREPLLICICITPCVLELRSECPVLPRLPRNLYTIVLIVSVLYLISSLNTLQRSTAWTCATSFFIIIVIVVRESIYRIITCSIRNNRVWCTVIIRICTTTKTLNLRLSETSLEINSYPLGWFILQLTIDIIFWVAWAKHDRILTIVSVWQIELELFRATRYIHCILTLITRTTEYLVLIICTCYTFPIFQLTIWTIIWQEKALMFRGKATWLLFILVVSKFIWTEDFVKSCSLLPTPACAYVYLNLTLCTTLSSYNDDTISTTSTIDSSRWRILQNIDRLNFRWSDVADRCNFKSVNNVKRWVILRKRTTTTHTNLDICIRWTLSGSNVHTCHLTCHSLSSTWHRNVLKLLLTHVGNSTCKVFLTNSTITDGYNFLKHLWVVLHSDVNRWLTCNINRLVLHTNVGEHQFVAFTFQGKVEVAIKVCYSTILGSLFHDSSTDDWFTSTILHVTADRLRLYCWAEEQQHSYERIAYVFSFFRHSLIVWLVLFDLLFSYIAWFVADFRKV